MMSNLEEAFCAINWKTLAEHKAALAEVAAGVTDKQTLSHICGVLYFLDTIMEAAEQDRFPVVYGVDVSVKEQV
jgi:hypothetical protein